MEHEWFYLCYDTGIDRLNFTFFFFHPQITLMIPKLHTVTTINSNLGKGNLTFSRLFSDISLRATAVPVWPTAAATVPGAFCRLCFRIKSQWWGAKQSIKKGKLVHGFGRQRWWFGARQAWVQIPIAWPLDQFRMSIFSICRERIT